MYVRRIKADSGTDSAHHIVDSAEYPIASFPFANNTWVVLGLVSCKIFFAGEATTRGLRAAWVPAKEGLRVSFMMLPQVAASCEDRP